MRSTSFQFAAILSALLGAAVLVACGLSFRTGVGWTQRHVDPTELPHALMRSSQSVFVTCGHLGFARSAVMVSYHSPAYAQFELAKPETPRIEKTTFAPTPVDYGGMTIRHFGVARYGWRFQNGTTFDRVLVMPMWVVALVFFALPALWARAYHRQRKRRVEGQCLACGYDLRGSPGRCPECGTPAPRPLAQQPVTSGVPEGPPD